MGLVFIISIMAAVLFVFWIFFLFCSFNFFPPFKKKTGLIESCYLQYKLLLFFVTSFASGYYTCLTSVLLNSLIIERASSEG